MTNDLISDKYVRIAELSEQIERINSLIAMHNELSDNQSMIRQYTFKRDEHISELEAALQSLHLNVRLAAA
jgi:hypothetical protein